MCMIVRFITLLDSVRYVQRAVNPVDNMKFLFNSNSLLYVVEWN